MRVVLDCRSVFEGMGGIGRATAALARALPDALDAGDELVLLTGARPPAEPLPEGPRVERVPTQAAMLDQVFEQLHLPGLLRELGADLVHMTCFATSIPAHEVARVATVHDVVFRRHPELVEPGLRSYLDHWTGVSCRLAEAVVTVSRFSAREISECYGTPTGRVHVVPNGVDPRFLRIERRPAAPPFLLHVGALERKKGVPHLLRAFRLLLERAPELPHRLVLAGGAGGQTFDLERALRDEAGPARERVVALGRVDEARLDGLYSAADVLVHLSAYEGFGLTVLEAMAAGTPVVVAARGALPEVAGEAALQVDPDDPEQVAATLAALLQDPARRAALAEQGQAHARGFGWDAAALRLVEVYRLALERHRARGERRLRVLRGGDA